MLLCAMVLLLPDAAASRDGAPEPGFDAAFDWLSGNPGHPEFHDRLEATLSLAEDVESLERVAREIVPLIDDRTLLADTARRLGRFAMTIRDYELAGELFESAYIASGGTDLASLFAQAQALLQTGRFTASEQRARTVVAETDDYELKRRAYALVARAMHLRGRHAEALRLLEILAELDDPEYVEPDSLLLQSAVLLALERSGTDPMRQLERLHPHSIAIRIASGRLVTPAPLPATLLTGTWDVSALAGRDTAVPAAHAPDGSSEPARPQAPRVSAIQVGSFSDPDNAVHLVADLKELGLEAHVETVDRDGRSLELVLVPVPGGSPEEAARVLAALQDAGYRGFLIY